MSKVPGLTAQETAQKHPLQAIVLGDAWGNEARWGPLCRRDRTDDEDYDEDELEVNAEQRPWCLLPLINIPLLSWTLECLAASGVQEAFIFVREGSEQVRTWLSTSPFTLPTSTLLVILRPTQAATPGDVLREVDSLGILAPTDFLVVQAGYVGNVNLEEKVREFTERRGRESSLAMSCLVAPRKTPTTSTFAVHVLSPDAQLYHYEESTFFPKLKQAMLPRDAFGPKDITVRADLESIGVAICNVEVPALFTENFDYQFFYPDFVNGILTSDLLGKTICCSIIDEESVLKDKKPTSGGRKCASWAAAVGNTKSFDSISQAILSRKAYPLAPDENLPDDSERYEHRGRGIYYGSDLDLSRTSSIQSSTLLGHHTSVGSNTIITHSIISPSVSIGSKCAISGSHIFSGAIIEDDCIIRDSIIGEKARIGKGSRIEGGSLIGGGTKLGNGARLSGGMASLEDRGVIGDELKGGFLGEDHKAYFWPSESNKANLDDTDDEDDTQDPRNFSMTTIGAKLDLLYLSDSSSSSSILSRSSSNASLSSNSNSDSEDSDFEPPAIAGIAQLSLATSPQDEFLSECKQSLDRSFEEGHTVENAVIEMKTLRMASNMPLALVRDFVIPYVLEKCATATAVKGIITRWGGLVSSLTGSEESEMAAGLLCAQRYVAEKRGGDLKFFSLVLRGFYEEDVVTEEAVLSWYKSKAARTISGEGKKLWEGAKPFIEALMEEDSDEDESD